MFARKRVRSRKYVVREHATGSAANEPSSCGTTVSGRKRMSGTPSSSSVAPLMRNDPVRVRSSLFLSPIRIVVVIVFELPSSTSVDIATKTRRCECLLLKKHSQHIGNERSLNQFTALRCTSDPKTYVIRKIIKQFPSHDFFFHHPD
jgi:hypothetical protein